MVIALLGVIIALQLLILYWVKPVVITSKLAPLRAIESAFRSVGLNGEHFHKDFDLVSAGKLGDIISHTAATLGKPLRTVEDVHNLLGK